MTTSQNANITGALRTAAATARTFGTPPGSSPGVTTTQAASATANAATAQKTISGPVTVATLPMTGPSRMPKIAAARAAPIISPRRSDGAAASSHPRAPVHAQAPPRPSAKRARSRMTTFSANAKTTLATDEQAQPREDRRLEADPGGEEARGQRRQQGAGGVGGAEDPGRGLREAEVVGVARQQRGDRRVEHRLDEDHRRNEREEPPHATTVARAARPAFRALAGSKVARDRPGRDGQRTAQTDLDPGVHRGDRLHHQLDRGLDALPPDPLRRRPRSGPERARAAASPPPPGDPGDHARRGRLAGDRPQPGREDGLDRGRQGDREARERRATSTSSSSPSRSPSTSPPRPATTSATWSSGSWSASTPSSGTTCRRGCAKRSRTASRSSCPGSSSRSSPRRSPTTSIRSWTRS